jgi:uncharacterized protein YndB with AHSA1/START domain
MTFAVASSLGGMTNTHLLGSLGGALDHTGVVRIEDRLATTPDDLWSALTDPGRLVHWLGEIEGDLRLGGTFRAHFFASGWNGTGRIEACEPARRLSLVTRGDEAAREHVVELRLTADGGSTILAWEATGMPPELVAAFAAGNQIHVEDLAAYLDGRGRCNAGARFDELYPAYQELAVA